MDSRDMQAIGLCRFSYPAIGGFQVDHETTEERIAYLYSNDRLEERFRLFETSALPCLRDQTDQNYDLIVVIGDSLPKEHRDRLYDLTADVPQVRIVTEPPRPQREVMKEILNKARKDPTKPCLQFRHDDDDAISVDFIERLRRTLNDCAGLVAGNRTVAVDFNRGYLAEIDAPGIAATETVRALYVAALGMYVKGGCKLTIMNFAHEKIGRFMPVISISDAPMWVRSLNDYNDSRQKKVKPVPVEPLTEDQKAEFAARFAIREDHVKRVFSGG